MTDWKYGDLMRYPRDQDDADPPNWVFMFVAPFNTGRGRLIQTYLNVIVVRTHWQDDLWETGTTLVAGVNEMVPWDG